MSDKYPGGFVTANAPAGFSVYFNGSTDYLSVASTNAVLPTGTQDYCVEAWMYWGTQSGTVPQIVSNPVNNGYQIYYDVATSVLAIGKYNIGNITTYSIAQSALANLWTHVVATRSGNTHRLFVNGVLRANVVDTFSFAALSTQIIGGSATAQGYFSGYLSNVRTTLGAIPTIYQTSSTTNGTSVFTPPTQLLNISGTTFLTCQSPTIRDNSSNGFTVTAAGSAAVSNFTPFAGYTGFNPALGAAAGGVWTLDEAAYYQNNRQWPIYDPYFKNTTLMLHGNGTNGAQNNTFLDSSTNNFTITRNGNTTQGSFSPFSQTGWSNYFNGSTDYLSVPSSANLAIGTGDYTLEAWLYMSSTSFSNQCFYGGTSSGGPIFTIRSQTSLVINPYGSGDTCTFTGAYFPANQWYHIAITRQSSTARLFVNGVLASTTTDSGNYGQTVVGVGGIGLYYWTGYVSNLRFIKGSAIYTSSFTPSTAPLTAVTGTQLLTSQSQRFVDSSANNFAITANSAPQVQAFSPFVPAYITPTTYSNWFNGSTGYFTTPNSSAFAFGTGDFTVEFWMASTDTAGGAGQVTGGTTGYWQVGLSGSQIVWQNSRDTNNLILLNIASYLNNSFNHFAFVRSGTTMTLYINGVSSATATDTTNYNGTAGALLIGQASDGNYFAGCLSNYRIVKGTAVYTANFTPPTAPLTAISGTSLLTCQSSTIVDNSASPNTLTVTGAVYPVTSPTPFPAKVDTTTLNSAYSTSLIGGSAYFDGSGDYLSIADNANLELGSSNFCIEMSIYKTTTSTTNVLINKRASNTSYGSYVILLYNNVLNAYFSSNGSSWDIISAGTFGTINLNTWNHVAVYRIGNAWYGSLNGVVTVLNASNSSSVVNVTAGITYGSEANGVDYFYGYISSARIVIGSSVYTSSNFAPPLAPPTPVTNTQLLLNYTNGAIFDNTAKNVLETVGNAQISTTQSKWGGSSMYFDGTGDWLSAPSTQNCVWGTGDFTIEFWIYPTTLNSSTDYNIMDFRDSNDTGSFRIGINGTTVPFLANSVGGVLNGSYTFTTNNWYHFAVTRRSGTLTIWINGASAGTNTTTTNFTGSKITIGAAVNNTGPYFGYLDDVRVTKGFSRYNGPFTPPTSQLQDQ